MKPEDLVQASVIREGKAYRRNRAGRWYYLHPTMGWCPIMDRKTAKMLDELDREHA